MSDTLQRILPILQDTYRATATVTSLAERLAERIDNRDWDTRGREHMILQECWIWYSGGSTAEAVAKEIEAALDGVS